MIKFLKTNLHKNSKLKNLEIHVCRTSTTVQPRTRLIVYSADTNRCMVDFELTKENLEQILKELNNGHQSESASNPVQNAGRSDSSS